MVAGYGAHAVDGADGVLYLHEEVGDLVAQRRRQAKLDADLVAVDLYVPDQAHVDDGQRHAGRGAARVDDAPEGRDHFFDRGSHRDPHGASRGVRRRLAFRAPLRELVVGDALLGRFDVQAN